MANIKEFIWARTEDERRAFLIWTKAPEHHNDFNAAALIWALSWRSLRDMQAELRVDEKVTFGKETEILTGIFVVSKDLFPPHFNGKVQEHFEDFCSGWNARAAVKDRK